LSATYKLKYKAPGTVPATPFSRTARHHPGTWSAWHADTCELSAAETGWFLCVFLLCNVEQKEVSLHDWRSGILWYKYKERRAPKPTAHSSAISHGLFWK